GQQGRHHQHAVPRSDRYGNPAKLPGGPRRRQDRGGAEARHPDATARDSRGLPRPRRVLPVRRRSLYHRPDHQRLGRPHHARMTRVADYNAILLDVRDGVAKITINRPEKYNAFTAQTVEELIDAFRRAGYDKSVAVIALGGAGGAPVMTIRCRSSGGAGRATRRSAPPPPRARTRALTKAAVPSACRLTNCNR